MPIYHKYKVLIGIGRLGALMECPDCHRRVLTIFVPVYHKTVLDEGECPVGTYHFVEYDPGKDELDEEKD